MSEVSGESGFEVARAYVAVSPDASDFADTLDEQVGGITVSAVVTPDASDFAAAFDEQVGGLSVSVVVTPDASDFADALDEQIGGLTATVTVVPDASDFADAVAEQTAGVTVPVILVPDSGDFSEAVGEQSGGVVDVTVVPNAADFMAALEEQVGGDAVSVMVTPDAADFAAGLDDQLGGLTVTAKVVPDFEELAATAGLAGAVPVTVTPDMTDFADKVAEEAAGITVSVEVVPGMGDFGDAVQEQADQVQAVVPVVPDAASLATSIEEQVGGEEISIPVTADTSSAVASLAELEEQAADDSGIQTLYNGILSIGPAASQAEMEAVDALTALGSTASEVSAQVSEMGGSAESAGSEASGAFTAAGESASSANSGIETFLGGIYSIGPAADEAGSQVADAMGNARQSIADMASAAGSVDYSAATEGLSGVAGAAEDVSKAAPAAADASSGLSGVLGMLAERMSYMAVDPFMWMYAAPVVIEGVSDAISGLSSISGDYVAELAKQDDATGYNISGYQKLSDQLGQAAQAYTASSDAVASGADVYGRAAAAANALASASQGMTAGQEQVETEIANVSTHLGTLEQQYGLTATQAESLATAAGVSATQLEGSGTAANDAMAKIEAYANANLAAGGSLAQLTTDEETFSNNTLTATARISALDNAYTTLAGNFVSEQQAQLAVQQGFDTLGTDAEAAGASMKGTNTASTALQQSFYSQASAIEQAANAMVQNGDSTQQVTSYINTQIGTLSTFEGGNKNASAAVQDLKKWEDSLTGSLESQGSYLATTLSNDLDAAVLKYSGVTTAVNDYAAALVEFGPKSQQAQNAQDQMNTAIINAGTAANQTTAQIAQMIAEQDKIPLKEAIQIVLNAQGQYTITQSESAGLTGNTAEANAVLPTPTGHAYGGLVLGGSGLRGADDIPSLLSNREYVVQSDAVDHYGVGLLDAINAKRYAGGGLVSGSYTGSGPGLGAFLDTEYGNTTTAAEVQLIGVVQGAESQAIADAKAAAKAHALGGWLGAGEVGLVGEAGPEYIMGGQTGATVRPGGGGISVSFNYYGTQQPSPEQQQAMMMQLAAAVGVS